MIYTATHALVVQVSSVYGLRPDLLSAQIQVESSGDPFAFRHEPDYYDRYLRERPTALGFQYGPLAACSYGLMQILFETALELGFDLPPWHLFDPRVGMTWGAKYMQQCLIRTQNDYRRALARYNGSGARADAYATRVFALRDAADKAPKDTKA